MWLLRRTKAAHGDGPPTDELSALPCDLLQRTLSFADAATLARLSRCSHLLRRAAAAAAGSKVSRLGSSITIKELLQHQWSELTMRLEHDQEEALATSGPSTRACCELSATRSRKTSRRCHSCKA